jgi:hypothetical protein
VVSGIGCAGRTPFVLDFNTMHTTHGRALAFATGIKLANPELHVIVIMGDGDASAIGGNHFIHACRRNLDLTALVFNNGIYGLTGGQLAPTTPMGKRSTTSVRRQHRAGVRSRPPRPGRRRRVRRPDHLLRPQAVTSLIKRAISSPRLLGRRHAHLLPDLLRTHERRRRALRHGPLPPRHQRPCRTAPAATPRPPDAQLMPTGIFRDEERADYAVAVPPEDRRRGHQRNGAS